MMQKVCGMGGGVCWWVVRLIEEENNKKNMLYAKPLKGSKPN